jgi:lipopolysaccharide transport system ATP-binding protein
MAATALVVDHVRKRYEIGIARRQRSDSLRETVSNAAAAQWRRLTRRSAARPHDDHIWALDDVSFSVNVGEVVGIIGRNGAGKSTLLKILSRITRPTSGWAEIHGRLGSLLEVGTGFHPDLSGRDNIYLNGAILGMRRAEIDRRFDEIVAFSGVERFLDTPVKRYSSGMYVRLAFAVAAHLEPDVLLVDEVLAVGDAEFQKKCIGKMQSVVRHGRTVLFVSHNMSAVKALCDRAVLLEAGRATADGPVDAVIDRYLGSGSAPLAQRVIPDDVHRTGTGEARFRSVELLTIDGRAVGELYFRQRFRVRAVIDVSTPVASVIAAIMIDSIDGTAVACAHNIDRGGAPFNLAPGSVCIEAELQLDLLPRTYSVRLALSRSDGYDIDVVHRTLDFSVLSIAETGADSYPWRNVIGYVRAESVWRAPEPIRSHSEPLTSAQPSSVGIR